MHQCMALGPGTGKPPCGGAAQVCGAGSFHPICLPIVSSGGEAAAGQWVVRGAGSRGRCSIFSGHFPFLSSCGRLRCHIRLDTGWAGPGPSRQPRGPLLLPLGRLQFQLQGTLGVRVLGTSLLVAAMSAPQLLAPASQKPLPTSVSAQQWSLSQARRLWGTSPKRLGRGPTSGVRARGLTPASCSAAAGPSSFL